MKKLLLFLLLFTFCKAISAQLQPAMADSFLHFIKTNKSKSSLFIVANDTVIASLNESKLMPLASTVKVLVAIEFAKQAARRVINAESYIALKDINKYYLPNTNDNGHANWLKFEGEIKNIKKDSIKLLEVAAGMMRFASNANEEFLMDILGFDNVKNNIQLFGLKQHSAIFPMASSLFMYQNPYKLSEAKVLKAISRLSEQEYCKSIFTIHNQLKYDSSFKPKFRLQDITPNAQKLWSQRLPSSTTKEYVQLVKILNKRKFLDYQAYGILAEILEFSMENIKFQKTFKHYGSMGGSTPTVFTHVVYAALRDGNKMEFSVFFEDLSAPQLQMLQRSIGFFEQRIITDKSFREKLSF